jgi:hypothetical protein
MAERAASDVAGIDESDGQRAGTRREQRNRRGATIRPNRCLEVTNPELICIHHGRTLHRKVTRVKASCGVAFPDGGHVDQASLARPTART